MTTGRKVAILGATGPVGRAVMESLKRRESDIVAVSRSAEKLERLRASIGGIEVEACDLVGEPSALATLAKCVDAFVLCAGVDPSRLADQVAMARAAVSAGAPRLLYVSSCWSFSPLVREVVDESHPRRPSGVIRYRAAAEDHVREHGGIVIHLPDFFGPHVHTSPLQRVIQLAARGRTVTWPAHGDVMREHIYIDDVGEIVAEALFSAPEGEAFVAPGSGPIAFDDIIDMTSTALDREVRARALGSLPLPVLKLVDPWSRHLGDAIQEYRKPVQYDGSRLLSQIGHRVPVDYSTGIQAVLRWLERRDTAS